MSYNHYKDVCRELKHDLKRKKRDIEDLEDQLKREEQESKRLKSENHDLWKLYYGLQQELQSAYERNSKLQVEKMTVEGLFERERHDFEKQQAEYMAVGQSSAKLQEALCAMQTEKLALQQKFNDLVVENKKLKDKEREVEPKLREVDELKRKVQQFEQLLSTLQATLAKQRNDLRDATVRKEQVDSYKRWNGQLKQELDQKTRKLTQWDVLVKSYASLESKLNESERAVKAGDEETAHLRRQLDDRDAKRRAVVETLSTLANQCSALRSEVNGAKAELSTFAKNLSEVKISAAAVENFPLSPTAMVEIVKLFCGANRPPQIMNQPQQKLQQTLDIQQQQHQQNGDIKADTQVQEESNSQPEPHPEVRKQQPEVLHSSQLIQPVE